MSHTATAYQNTTRSSAQASSHNNQSVQHSQNLQAHTANSTYPIMEDRKQPSTPPRTPRKAAFAKGYGSGAVSDSASKPKSKAKHRPKHVMTSPQNATGYNRGTPMPVQSAGFQSSSSRPISTPSAAAYAGPTFHASPAPSALPIPSFFSKSVPESPGPLRKLVSQTDDLLPAGEDEGSLSPSPGAPSLISTQREDSPLDFFFKADRAEKARERNYQSESASDSGPFNPPLNSPSNRFAARGSSGQSRSRPAHYSGGGTGGIFAMELDGSESPGKPYGAPFSTSYRDRIDAARSSPSLAAPQLQQSAASLPSSTASADALKAYLFTPQKPSALEDSRDVTPGWTGPQDPPTQRPENSFRNTQAPCGSQQGNVPRPTSNNLPHSQDTANTSFPRAGSRGSGLRQEVLQNAKPPLESSNRDLNVMEDRLRKMLNIGNPPSGL